MRAWLADEMGSIYGHDDSRVPECGEDFCDDCGDCSACYEDGCPDNDWGDHRWVIYDGDDDEPCP